jgi:hypothetical protein
MTVLPVQSWKTTGSVGHIFNFYLNDIPIRWAKPSVLQILRCKQNNLTK